MILLVGYSTERTFAHFTNFVKERGVHVEVMDLAELQAVDSLTIFDDSDDLRIRIGERSFVLKEYSGIYTRAYYTDFGSASANFAISTLLTHLMAFLESAEVPVVNRPSAGMSNVNKFIHSRILEKYGLAGPKTFILGSADQASELIAGNSSWVSKSCSSVKTRVVAVDENLVKRFKHLKTAPSMFQQRITGPDVRIHIVGNDLFPEAILSSNIDYRYPDRGRPRNQFYGCEVPESIADACRQYCQDENLLFAGFDFKIAKTGQWFVLEANSMPGYENYDLRQEQRISNALLRILTSG